jgi:hypothetical protein
MSDPALPIQGALVTLLKGLNTTAGTRVYDHVPRGNNGQITATFPYIALGGGSSDPVDEECQDRTETSITIDFWSRAVGFPEAKTAASIIRAALHEQPLTVAGHTVDRMYVDRVDYLRDPDGLTSRARLTLAIETTAA